MATTVFPETSDAVTEATWQSLNKAISAGGSWTTEGFDVTDGGGLDVDVAAGKALVDGYLIESDSTQSVSLADDDTNYLWLEPDGTLTDNTTGTNPGSALLLAVIVTASGSISSISKDQDVLTGPYMYVRKTAAESVASSTTLQDDDHLTIALQPGIYRFTFILEATWAASVGLKVGLACTATDANVNAAVIFSNSSGSTPAGWGYIGFDFTGSVSYQTYAGTNDPVMIEGALTLADAGTFKLQWAQVTSNATNTTLEDGSRLFVERIA